MTITPGENSIEHFDEFDSSDSKGSISPGENSIEHFDDSPPCSLYEPINPKLNPSCENCNFGPDGQYPENC